MHLGTRYRALVSNQHTGVPPSRVSEDPEGPFSRQSNRQTPPLSGQTADLDSWGQEPESISNFRSDTQHLPAHQSPYPADGRRSALRQHQSPCASPRRSTLGYSGSSESG